MSQTDFENEFRASSEMPDMGTSIQVRQQWSIAMDGAMAKVDSSGLGVSSWWRHELGFIFLGGWHSSYCPPQRSDDSIEKGQLMVLAGKLQILAFAYIWLCNKPDKQTKEQTNKRRTPKVTSKSLFLWLYSC